MIKKTTTATFRDGAYQGTYDWEGGIPLSRGEVIKVTIDASQLAYRLVKKDVALEVDGQSQSVAITYEFELAD